MNFVSPYPPSPCVCRALLVAPDQRVLLVKRGDAQWGFPQGVMDVGSSLTEAHKRMVEDQTGIVSEGEVVMGGPETEAHKQMIEAETGIVPTEWHVAHIVIHPRTQTQTGTVHLLSTVVFNVANWEGELHENARWFGSDELMALTEVFKTYLEVLADYSDSVNRG